MTDQVDPIQRIEHALVADRLPPYRASAIGVDLFSLTLAPAGHADHQRLERARQTFLTKLEEWGLQDLLSRQMLYAIRIAGSVGSLEYEEMHKLLALCDEVHALTRLGLVTDANVHAQFEAAVRSRFERERRKAKLAAQDRAQGWNRALWWYAENL